MSLYAHFGSKNELLDLTFERLLSKIVPEPCFDAWRAELESMCREMRRRLLEHPHWVALLARVAAPEPAIGIYDHLLALMARDGFEAEAAMFAFSSAMSLVIGSVLVERMMAGSGRSVPAQRLALIKDLLVGMPTERYAHVADASRCFERWSFDEVFELELRSMLGGLEALARQRDRSDRRSA